MMNQIQLDVHTHSIASGHAYGTITEMAMEASKKGLKILGITEHAQGIPGTCEDIYFSNLKVVPRQMFGVELLLGAEINILNYEGMLSMEPKYIRHLDIRIAGIHDMCYTIGSTQNNTDAVVGAIKNPQIDIISHPDDGNCPLDYEQIVHMAKQYHTLLEVNNNAARSSTRKNVSENIKTMLTLCKKDRQPVILSSDAHFMDDIANFDHIEMLLKEIEFPEDLILNYSTRTFRDYLSFNRRKELAIQN